ncbi:MAG: hypothetical protein LBT59_08795 [Clostridiales bacterium]|jgi:hypothetical protein|nr:hypothetical protein [Clostridiales bacterium]
MPSKRIVKAAAAFLAVMLAFTLASSKIDYWMTPEVRVAGRMSQSLGYDARSRGVYRDSFVYFSIGLEQDSILKEGGRVYASFSNLAGRVDCIVAEKSFDENSQSVVAKCKASGAEGAYDGQECDVSFRHSIGTYPNVLPKGCVFREGGGTYVYRVETESGALGESYVARRQEVDVEAEDDFNAAVSQSLSERDLFISGTTKAVKNGMKVRIAQ